MIFPKWKDTIWTTRVGGLVENVGVFHSCVPRSIPTEGVFEITLVNTLCKFSRLLSTAVACVHAPLVPWWWVPHLMGVNCWLTTGYPGVRAQRGHDDTTELFFWILIKKKDTIWKKMLGLITHFISIAWLKLVSIVSISTIHCHNMKRNVRVNYTFHSYSLI